MCALSVVSALLLLTGRSAFAQKRTNPSLLPMTRSASLLRPRLVKSRVLTRMERVSRKMSVAGRRACGRDSCGRLLQGAMQVALLSRPWAPDERGMGI
jgi:predicted ABC-class ATPase